MNISQLNTFAPAGSVSQIIPAGGGVAALPAVDAGNVSLLVMNTGGGPVYFNLQNDQVMRGGAGAPGSYQLLAGASLLFAPSGLGDYPNTISSTATYSAVVAYAGGNLTFTRGTVTTQTVLAPA